MKELDEITSTIIEAAIRVHRRLGPGLLESVYQGVLAYELVKRGLLVEPQKEVGVEYDGLSFDQGFRVDLVVEGLVLVELKSAERSHPVYKKQLLTYLRLMNLQVGLLINFGAPTLKDGLTRVVNSLPAAASPALEVNRLREPRASA